MPKFSKEGFWFVFRTGVLLRNPFEILPVIGEGSSREPGFV